MNLTNCATDSRPVVSDHDEKIFSYEPQFLICIHDLNMSESLAIGADFILTFDDEDASFSKNAPRFPSSFLIQVYNCLMIFAAGLFS